VKLYQYPKCDTCRRAVKFLDAAGLDYVSINIAERPPTAGELRQMLEHQDGALRKLFNVSGLQYRELNLKEHLAEMSIDDAFGLLADNGMLVKRPFLLADGAGLVGFDEGLWSRALMRK
jgi:arsenate reductase